MKITKLQVGILSIFALVMALASCGSDSGLSLPGAKDVKEVQTFAGEAPSTEKQAFKLLETVFNENYGFGETLALLNQAAFDKAFLRKTGFLQDIYLIGKSNEKSVSVSVDFTDRDSINAFAGSLAAAASVRIKGKSSVSYKSNRLTVAQALYGYSPKQEGDTISFSESFNKTVDLHDYAITSDSFPNYKVSGIITVESSSNTQSKTKTLPTSTSFGHIEYNESGSEKVSATLSITDGTMSAKFKFSYVYEIDDSIRHASGGENAIFSDIEVYDSNNKKLFTFYEDGSFTLLQGFSEYLADFNLLDSSL